VEAHYIVNPIRRGDSRGSENLNVLVGSRRAGFIYGFADQTLDSAGKRVPPGKGPDKSRASQKPKIHHRIRWST